MARMIAILMVIGILLGSASGCSPDATENFRMISEGTGAANDLIDTTHRLMDLVEAFH